VFILLCVFAANTPSLPIGLANRQRSITFYWFGIHVLAQELIKNLLEVDANKRFSARQLLEYHWVAVCKVLSLLMYKILV